MILENHPRIVGAAFRLARRIAALAGASIVREREGGTLERTRDRLSFRVLSEHAVERRVPGYAVTDLRHCRFHLAIS